jgi:hypothetical protein
MIRIDLGPEALVNRWVSRWLYMYTVKATTIRKDAVKSTRKVVRSEKTPRMSMHHDCRIVVSCASTCFSYLYSNNKKL